MDNYFALHIRPLDDNEESDDILNRLKSYGIGNKWPVEKPTSETNAIFVPIEADSDTKEGWQAKQSIINKSLDFFKGLDREIIDFIKSLDLFVSLRIHTTESNLLLPEEVIHECSRLGLEIYILNITTLEQELGIKIKNG